MTERGGNAGLLPSENTYSSSPAVKNANTQLESWQHQHTDSTSRAGEAAAAAHCATEAGITGHGGLPGALPAAPPASCSSGANTPLIDRDIEGLRFPAHMAAGAAAGIAEHVAMYPVDTIKTRMQALAHPGQKLRGMPLNTVMALRAVVRREGWRGLYGGVGAVVSGAGPAHALYFASYEFVKDRLGGNQAGHHPVAAGLAGAAATVVNDGVMTPADVIKQRLQVAHSPYRGLLDCLLRVVREEGPSAFFKSLRTTLLMNVPFTAIHFPVYESAKKLLGDGDDSLHVQLIAGGMAGGTAAGLTNPLDVVKTRLQLEGVNSARRYGTTAVVPLLKKIAREEGPRALWHGVQPRVLFHAPAAAICWGTYETMKKLLAAQ